jgi:hypothetical protein
LAGFRENRVYNFGHRLDYIAESHLEPVVEELLTVGVHPGVELLLELAGRGGVV